MARIHYRIVAHDGGWAYKLNDVFSEPFPSKSAARPQPKEWPPSNMFLVIPPTSSFRMILARGIRIVRRGRSTGCRCGCLVTARATEEPRLLASGYISVSFRRSALLQSQRFWR